MTARGQTHSAKSSEIIDAPEPVKHEGAQEVKTGRVGRSGGWKEGPKQVCGMSTSLQGSRHLSDDAPGWRGQMHPRYEARGFFRSVIPN